MSILGKCTLGFLQQEGGKKILTQNIFAVRSPRAPKIDQCNVLLSAFPCRWQLVHLDHEDDDRSVNTVTSIVSMPVINLSNYK